MLVGAAGPETGQRPGVTAVPRGPEAIGTILRLLDTRERLATGAPSPGRDGYLTAASEADASSVGTPSTSDSGPVTQTVLSA